MKYEIIYCDPPWKFSNKKTGGTMKSGAVNKYPVMTLDDLKSLDVNSISADNCTLVMWWVGSMPQESIDLVNAWGFTLKNMNGFVWGKLTKNFLAFFGMGFRTRAGTESAIIAIKGKPKVYSKSVRAFRLSVVGKHSEKPKEFRDDIVELCGELPRLEMFARERTPDWSVFGNEVEGSIKIGIKKP